MTKQEITNEIVKASNLRTQNGIDKATRFMMRHDKDSLERAYKFYKEGSVSANQIIHIYTGIRTAITIQ